MSLGKNQLFYGDNYEVLQKYIKDESIDLVYIDPPFNSKRNYNQIYNNIGTEDKAQAQAFVDTWSWDDAANIGYEEIISNKCGFLTSQSIDLIVGLEKVLKRGALFAYLVSMTQRINEMWRVLKPTGSFYLHCDPTASHYLKLVCDAVFTSRSGEFQNEIIWGYSHGGKSKKHFGRKHDVIIYYSKSKNYLFNGDSVKIEMKSGKTSFGGKLREDEDGRKYRLVYGSKNSEGKTKYYKYYLDEGKIPEDYWIDIKPINSQAKERLGYPTQKPEALLERIIEDTIGKDNIQINTNKPPNPLKGEKTISDSSLSNNIEVFGIPQDFEGAIALANKKDDRVRKEFEKWAVLTFSNNRATINEKKDGDGGIDGIAYIKDLDQNNKQIIKKILFSVKSNKNLTPSVIRDLNGTIEREDAVMGYLITLYPMENLVKEAKKYGVYKNTFHKESIPKIEVITIDELLQGKRMINSQWSVDVVKSALRDWDYDNKQKSILDEEVN